MSTQVDMYFRYTVKLGQGEALNFEVVRSRSSRSKAQDIWLRTTYFRTEHEGLENIPRDLPYIVVSTHSGGPMLRDVWPMLATWWNLFSPEVPRTRWSTMRCSACRSCATR